VGAEIGMIRSRDLMIGTLTSAIRNDSIALTVNRGRGFERVL
jgi:hypothetical protein